MVDLPQVTVPLLTDTGIISVPSTGQKRLYGPAQPQVLTSPPPSPFVETLYAVPPDTKTVVTRIFIMNTASLTSPPTDNTITLCIGPIDKASAILWEFVVEPKKFENIPVEIEMNASETIHGIQSTNGALTVTISGTEAAA